MKIYILLFVLSLAGFWGQAQSIDTNNPETSEIEDKVRVKVYMNNGSVIFGEFEDYDPEKGIWIKINDRILFLGKEHFRKFSTVNNYGKKVHNPLKSKKVYYRTNLGLLANTNGTGTSLNISALYQFSPHLSAGVGIGVDNYYFNAPHNIFPVFTEFKGYLVDKRSSPFVSIKTGYSFNRPHEDSGQLVARGGILFNPTFGYRFGSEGIMFDIYFGLRLQKAYYEKLTWAFSRQDILWRRVEIGSALSF